MSNARAARRRGQKAELFAPPEASITLENPVSHHFGAFIVGNAKYCADVVEGNTAIGKHVVICGAGPSLADHAADYCPTADAVWGCNSAAMWLHERGHRVTHAFTVDQTAHMCAEWYATPDLEYLIASSVHPNLVELLNLRGRRMRFFHNFVGIQKPPVEYAVCPDCGDVMEAEFDRNDCDHAARAAQWTDWMKRRGRKISQQLADASQAMATSLGLVYNCVPYEHWLYASHYPPTMQAGSGLNATTRAIDVALVMGFDRITVLGADGALRIKSPRPDGAPDSPERLKWLREQTIMHADGGHALASGATPMTMGAIIDDETPDDTVRVGHGRYWETKIDLVITAVWLHRMKQFYDARRGDPSIVYRPRLEIIGDTLTRAIRNKTDDYIDRLPSLKDSMGKPMKITITAPI